MQISADDASGGLRVTMEAPYFNSPGSSQELVVTLSDFSQQKQAENYLSNQGISSGMCPGHPSFYLWKFEVVEVYLLNDEGRYFQLELSPDGRFFAILFREHRDWVSCTDFFLHFFRFVN